MVDKKMLKRLVRSHELGTMKAVAKDIGVSVTILGELINGRYKPQVKEQTRALICKGLGVNEDELFPLVGASDEKSAS